MAKQIERVIYYNSILNVLSVVESCPKNLKKTLKQNEYQQALAVLDYNSQWVGLEALTTECKDKLINLAKDPEKRQKCRELIDVFARKRRGAVVTVENLLKQAGD